MSDRSASLPITQEDNSQPPAKQPEPVQEWLPIETLASLAEIGERCARKAAVKCLSGGTWRGVHLEVRHEGRALLIHGPSLPAGLRDIWHSRYQIGNPDKTPATAALPAKDDQTSRAAAAVAEKEWKLSILAPALLYPRSSRERAEALRQIAGKEYTKPNGKPFTPGMSTLHDWIRALSSEGEHALARKPRKKEETPRVLVNRAWDAACTLPEAKKAEIAEQIAEHVKTLWKDGAPGWPRINQLASAQLLDLCRAAGWEGATLDSCTPGRAMVEKFREFGVIAIKEKHAKLFFDRFTPRIHRNRKGYKPGDIVVGDVHPFDVQREVDGRIVHARLISWLDIATYDLFVTVVILPPGRGIRQEDVAASFVDMVMKWGLPRQLRLDHGPEYKWDAMIKGFYALAGLVDNFYKFSVSILGAGDAGEMIDGEQFEPRQAVSRARPYNAPAKQIESVFGIVETSFFSMMRGWIGGDRMNKRTHKVGEAPLAHDGTEEEFIREIGICLDLYRNTRQKDCSSPNEKRQAAIAQGWQPVCPSRQTLMYALSETRNVKVHTSGINVDGKWYYADVLVTLIGKKIEINVAKWDRSHVFYFDGAAEKVRAIPLTIYYEQDDPAGAKEQARRAGIQNLYLRELKTQTGKLDLVAEAARYNAALPPPPVLPEGITITTHEGEKIAEALEAAKAPPPVCLLPGERIHPTTGARLTIAPPEEKRPGAVAATPGPANGLPLPSLPKPPSNPLPAEFDPLKRLLAGRESQPKE